jgi:DNA-binding CsgD family transcriptional regulator
MVPNHQRWELESEQEPEPQGTLAGVPAAPVNLRVVLGMAPEPGRAGDHPPLALVGVDGFTVAQPYRDQALQLLDEGLRQLTDSINESVRAYHAMAAVLLQSVFQASVGESPVPCPLIDEVGQNLREREQARLCLTQQEVEILRLAASGLSNRDIGARQFWSEITIKRKMGDIYRKLGVRNRAEAVAKTMRLGII